MLRLDLHLRHLKSGTPGSNEITDGGGVSEEAELVHCQENQTSSHHFRQRLGVQGYRKLDKEDTEEREKTSDGNSTFPDPHGGVECMSGLSKT